MLKEMKMPRCPNCSYILVLLERRRKYKCAKCGKLFPQKETDAKEFRAYNKRQREIDAGLIPVRKRNRNISTKDPEKKRAYEREHYQKNKERILEQKKLCRQKNKAKNNETRKIYRKLDPENTRTLSRIEYWRNKQKELAIEQFLTSGQSLLLE